MVQLANAYTKINDLLNNPEKHHLSYMDISALEVAQKAILAIEMLGLELKEYQT